MIQVDKLPERWRGLSNELEQQKALVAWASEQYLSHCAVQATLERCADELEAVAAEETSESVEEKT